MRSYVRTPLYDTNNVHLFSSLLTVGLHREGSDCPFCRQWFANMASVLDICDGLQIDSRAAPSDQKRTSWLTKLSGWEARV